MAADLMHLPWRDVETSPGGPAVSTSITPAEAALLAVLADGRDVLEVGSAYGYSACVMASAGAAKVTAVDVHWQLQSLLAMQRNLEAAGVKERVEIVIEDSRRALPRFAQAGRQFGLIFIDGDHLAPGVESDVGWALELAAPGGVIAAHDYGEDCCCPDVRGVLDAQFPNGPDELADTLFVVKT